MPKTDIALPPGPPGPPPAPPYAPSPPPVPPGPIMRSPEEHLYEMAKKYKVDPKIAESIMRAESGGRQTGTDGQVLTSPAGAQGMFQLMPATAFQEFNLDPKDPFQNVEAGIRYLRQGMDRGDGTIKGLASYYHGGPNSQQWGPVTQKYAQDVEDDLRQQLDAQEAQAAQAKAPAAAAAAAPPTQAPAATAKRKSGDWATPEGLAAATAAANSGPPPQPWYIRGANALGETAADVATGAARNWGKTFTTLGEAVHQIPGVSAGVDWISGLPPGSSQASFAAMRDQLGENQGWAQKIGGGAEMIGEGIAAGGGINSAANTAEKLFAPKLAGYMGNIGKTAIGKTASKVLPRMAVEAAGGAGLAAAEGGDPEIGALFGAGAPVVGAAADVAGPWLGRKLNARAADLVEKAFKGTSQRYKAKVQKRVQQILDAGRGDAKRNTSLYPNRLTGGRAKMEAAAGAARTEAGQEIDSIMQAHGGDSFNGTHKMLTYLEDLKDKFRNRIIKKGKPAYNVIDPRPIDQIEELQQVIAKHGWSPTMADMVKIRKVWDTTLDEVGAFAHRAPKAIGLSLRERTEEWSKLKGANFLRGLITEDLPELAVPNHTYSFYADIEDALRQTRQRTTPQEGGVGRIISKLTLPAIAGAVGFGTDSVGKAIGAYALGEVGVLVHQAMTSPGWRMASANTHYAMSEALRSGNAGKAAEIATMILGAHEAAPPPPVPPPSLAPDYSDLWGTRVNNPNKKAAGGPGGPNATPSPPPPPGRTPGEVYATVSPR
jgi:hypothetical protein